MGNGINVKDIEKLETIIIEILGGLETVEIALYATADECAKNPGIAKVVEMLHTSASCCADLLHELRMEVTA